MRKPKIRLNIIKENLGYSAIGKWQNRHFNTCADSWLELQINIIEMLNLSFEDLSQIYTIDEIKFEYDLASFFDFYKVINAKALSERIGMSQSLLSQYINGIKKPSAKQAKRILQGVHQIGKELTEVEFMIKH